MAASLSQSLSLPGHSLTGSHSASALYHLLCIFNYPTLHELHPSFFLPLHCLNVSTWFSLAYLLPDLSLSSPPDLNFSLFSPSLPLSLSFLVVVSLKGTVLLLTGCYTKQTEGEGKPVGETVRWSTARYLNAVYFTLFGVFLSLLFFVSLVSG